MNSQAKLAELKAERDLIAWRIAVIEFALELYERGPSEPTFVASYMAAGMPPRNRRRT